MLNVDHFTRPSRQSLHHDPGAILFLASSIRSCVHAGPYLALSSTISMRDWHVLPFINVLSVLPVLNELPLLAVSAVSVGADPNQEGAGPLGPPIEGVTGGSNDFFDVMDYLGSPTGTLRIDVDPGDGDWEEERRMLEEIVGDGFGERNEFLTDSPFLPEILAVHANDYMPAIFPQHER